MKYEKLAPFKKQLGNKVLEFKDNKIYGYNIITYINYEPDLLEFVGVIENPINNVLSIDTAYDRLFGAPTIPNFKKVITI